MRLTMKNKLRFILAQFNSTVGDIQNNLKKHIETAISARDKQSADVIIFPELSLTGYPPEDLLLRQHFLDEAHYALHQFIDKVNDIYCLIGHPHLTNQGLFNACSLIYNGKIIACHTKQNLPNYGVFDEHRYFKSGQMSTTVVPINDIPVGLVICEDLWHEEAVKDAKQRGAKLIISPNASPFESDKYERRTALLSHHAKENNIPIIYVNTVGGQDELVFDGGSMLVSQDGSICQTAPFFKEVQLPVDISFDQTSLKVSSTLSIIPKKEERIYQALVLATHDYIEKNKFPGVLIGLSGGIDSALVLTIAVDALGKDRVKAVMMPSRYTSRISMEDAEKIATALHVELLSISIEPVYQQFLESLLTFTIANKPSITEENIQARCRAVILMAHSNQSGRLVLTTGNRSELAVGYCTLYGDMAGGFAVLKDIPKTLVYALARYRNKINPVIPERTITRAPTAELAPNQKDEDSLPPYTILDDILLRYLNLGQSIDQIVQAGFERQLVTRVVHLVLKNEYKRRQSAVGPHINHYSFGKEWRYPMTNGFKG